MKRIKNLAIKIVCLMVLIVINLWLLIGCISNGEVISEEPFYSLQAAYDSGFITKEDLKCIEGFHKEGSADVINGEILSEIKASYFAIYPQSESTVDDITIDKYYGSYRDCVALMIGYVNSTYTATIWSETIAGVKIEYNNGQRILIWKK